MITKYDISIVIPCRKSDTTIYKVLNSLQGQKDCHYEVIVVTNPPTTKNEIVSINYSLTFLNSAKGTNTARNRGLQEAHSDLILFLDSDCIIEDPYFLKRYIDHMNQNPTLTGCGGPYELTSQENAVSMAYHKIQTHWLYGGLINQEYKTRHLLGGNFVLRKSRLNSQKFDETIIFGGTETELLTRLYLQKHEFQLLKTQKVSHIAKVSLLSLGKKAFKQGQGQRYTIHKLKIKKDKPDTFHLQYSLSLDSPQFLIRFYRFFFQIGCGEFLLNKKNEIRTLVTYYYYKIDFYLNLIKRSE